MTKPKLKGSNRETEPTGIEEIDRLAGLSSASIGDYIKGVSAYVKREKDLPAGPKKAAQIRLSNALARALADELGDKLPIVKGRLVTHEQKVAGGLRTVNADVSESHSLDGLRLAVELKPINLAVGRAIWNRFGDIRTFAVNIHLKFPFAVVGGVLVIPTYEEVGTKEAKRADQVEEKISEHPDEVDPSEEVANSAHKSSIGTEPRRKPTLQLIGKAINRLVRAGGRKSEAEAAHLLEGIAVVVYDPDLGAILPDLPTAGSGLRWEEFLEAIASSYRARFED